MFVNFNHTQHATLSIVYETLAINHTFHLTLSSLLTVHLQLAIPIQHTLK